MHQVSCVVGGGGGGGGAGLTMGRVMRAVSLAPAGAGGTEAAGRGEPGAGMETMARRQLVSNVLRE